MASCRTNRENSVSLQKGTGEFELYCEMADVIKSYKTDVTMTVSDVMERFKTWLRDDFITTSQWQKADASKKAMAKVERYLKANPEKSIKTTWINFRFGGEEFTEFKPDFAVLYDIPTPCAFLIAKGLPDKMPMLQLVKFSAGKQQV